MKRVIVDENGMILTCPDCDSDHLVKFGASFKAKVKKQIYQCRDCGRTTVKPTRKQP